MEEGGVQRLGVGKEWTLEVSWIEFQSAGKSALETDADTREWRRVEARRRSADGLETLPVVVAAVVVDRNCRRHSWTGQS
jgi:predicted DCC family thiol-disulfide oxidoreductase YuxK